MNSQINFLNFIIKKNVINFGKFLLKSGRISPYFYNSRKFNTGKDLNILADYYNKIIINSNIKFDMLFGIPYSGIPLVCTIAINLYKKNINIPFSFSRKEKKKYGEKKDFIGTKPFGRILIIDDVITSGISLINSIDFLLSYENVLIVGAVVQFNRREKNNISYISAVKKIEKKYNFPIFSILKLEDIILYYKNNNYEYFQKIKKYIKLYGI